jgi:hypothetical protein
METVTKPTAKATTKKVLKQADELMQRHAKAIEQRKLLLDSIMVELKVYEMDIKETERQLIEIGEQNKEIFNTDGNLVFDDGYLHIAKNTVVITKKKFDLALFAAAKPDLIDVTLKTNPIKKAFMDKDMRKELVGFGVDVDTVDKVQVICKKKI